MSDPDLMTPEAFREAMIDAEFKTPGDWGRVMVHVAALRRALEDERRRNAQQAEELAATMRILRMHAVEWGLP